MTKAKDCPPPPQIEYGYCLDCGCLVDNTDCGEVCKWDGSDWRERGSRYKVVTYVLLRETQERS